MIPGEVLVADGDIELNAGRRTVTLSVANTGDRPVQVGSHFHFFEVNRALEESVRMNPPPKTGRGGLKLYYATQSGIKPPTIVVFVNNPEKVYFSYRRYLTNQFRERLGLDLCPVQLIFRKR